MRVYNKPEVARLTEDGLEREVWCFEVLDFPQVLLASYAKQHRKTRRHKWVSSVKYTRLSTGREIGYDIKRLQKEPDVPADVLNEALEMMRAQIVFVKWRTP